MTRFGMVFDVTKCNGCYNCFIVCKDEYCGNDHKGYSAALPMTGQTFMTVVEKERGQYPKVKVDYVGHMCQQCEAMPCGNGNPDAVYKRDDGIVMIDPEESAGDKDLVNRCPYRVISWNEEKKVAQKCTMCAHLLDDGWKEPRCVEACPTKALVFGDLDDPGSEISELVRVRRVRAARRLQAGREGLLHRPAQGVHRGSGGLRRQGRMRQGRRRDPGVRRQDRRDRQDRRLRRLRVRRPDGPHAVQVRIVAAGYDPKAIDVKLYKSVNLGDIIL